MADFGEGAPVVTDGGFPSRTPEEPRLLGGAIPLNPGVARMKHGAFTGRRDQRNAVPLGRRVAQAAVVGAVANHDGAGRWLGKLQHHAEHLRVVFLARGDHAGYHEGGRWINPEMDFAVSAALQSMDGGQPGAGTADLHPGGINHEAAAGNLHDLRRSAFPPSRAYRFSDRRFLVPFTPPLAPALPDLPRFALATHTP